MWERASVCIGMWEDGGNEEKSGCDDGAERENDEDDDDCIEWIQSGIPFWLIAIYREKCS